jgi:hypothetical protein
LNEPSFPPQDYWRFLYRGKTPGLMLEATARDL